MRQNAILLAVLLLFTAVAVAEEENIGAESFPKEMVLSGRSKHSYHTFFSGEEVVVEVYEAEPAKLKIDEPWPYDERRVHPRVEREARPDRREGRGY